MFKCRRPHDVTETKTVYFDKTAQSFCTLDEDGKPVPTRNALTDPQYKDIDYSDMSGIDYSNYGDYS